MSVDLRVDWCSYEAAKYAVEKWHYSRSMPGSKTLKMGVWENGIFIGAVIFSWGANRLIGEPYGLIQGQVCELARVALNDHASPVSQIVTICIKMLINQSPGVRLLVSYADPSQAHVGSIYQAMNWIYEGVCKPIGVIALDGKLLHKKTVFSKYGTNSASKVGGRWVKTPGKYKYLYPLDRVMRKQVAPLAKPYPKRGICVQSVEGDTVGDQPTGEGSIPSDRF